MSHWSLSLRFPRTNPNHHIWSNNGTWWVHYTVHVGHRKKRLRESLGTHDVVEARIRRDSLLAGAGVLLPPGDPREIALREDNRIAGDIAQLESV